MAKLQLVKGSLNSTQLIFIQDSSSTTGAGLTGLVFNSAGLACYYTRPGAVATQLTLATQTVTGAHSDGGFVEIDATNAAGLYRLDLSDAILATGVDSVVVYLDGAANMAQLPLEIQLTTLDLNTATVAANVTQIGGQTVTAAAAVTVNAEIGASATSMNNFDLQYDGVTGLIGDPFPASQAQVGNIATGSAAISVQAESQVLTTGSEVNNYINTTTKDGVYHEITDAAGAMEIYYQFDVGGNGVATEVSMWGRLFSANDTVGVYGYNWAGASWDQVGDLEGVGGSTDGFLSFSLLARHTGTGVNIGKVRVRGYAASGLTTSTMYIDQAFVSFAVVSQSVGYALGRIWVNTNNGTAGSVAFVNGVADKSVLTWADALLLSASSSVNITDFNIVNGGAITLSATSDNFSIFGDNYAVALGGQSCADIQIVGASVSGAGTAASGEMHFEGCDITTASVQTGHFDFCGFSSTLTMTLAGDYNYHNCYSKVAGSGSPVFAKTAGQAITAQWRNWAGSMTFSGLEVGDTLTVGGTLGTIDLGSPAGAVAVEIRGTYKAVTNIGSAVVNYTGAILGGDVAAILDDTGTSGVLLAASATSAQLVDDVWDEVLTGGAHNVTDSAGKRIRDLQEFGSYEGGAIFIDTVNGAAGATNYESGTILNPVSTIADANTLATSLSLSRFELAPASSITFAASQAGQVFRGAGWSLALGGQDISNTDIVGAQSITGTATTPTGEAHFLNCEFVSGTLGQSHLRFCGVTGTLTLSAAASYTMSDCYSQVPGAATPIIDFGALVGNTSLSMRRYSGGIEVQNYGATGTDAMSLEGDGQLIINANCTGGTIYVRGNFLVTDNSGGAVTVVYDANSQGIADVLVDTGATIPNQIDAISTLLTTTGVVLTAAERTAVAAALLAYDMGGSRTVEESLAFLRNRWTIIGGTLTVYDTDDTTVLWTSVMTQTAGDNVSASDPV